MLRNQTAILECIVIIPTDASAEIRWTKLSTQTAGLPDPVRAFSPGNSVLRISAARLEDAGTYQCGIITAEGQASADIQLVVVSKSLNSGVNLGTVVSQLYCRKSPDMKWLFKYNYSQRITLHP